MQLAKAVVTLPRNHLCTIIYTPCKSFFLEPNKNKIWIIANNIKNVNEIHVCKLICIKKMQKSFYIIYPKF